MKILKFGGTSVGSASALGRLRDIVWAEAGHWEASPRGGGDGTDFFRIDTPLVVVVSALSGVTNRLEALASGSPGEQATGGREDLEWLRARHVDVAEELHRDGGLSRAGLRMYRNHMRIVLGRVALRLTEIEATGAWREEDRDTVLSVGERLSAPLVALVLGSGAAEHGPAEPTAEQVRSRRSSFTWVDARNLIRTDSRFGAAEVDLEATHRAVRAWHAHLRPGTVPVVTGYIGRSACGRTTTLGRGGSDYTAALLAEALGADKLDRWTDVPGLFTADPRRDASARRHAFLLAEDAATWNAARGLGMHARAFEPVVRGCIPVHVRSTAHPHADGTLIVPARLPERIRTRL